MCKFGTLQRTDNSFLIITVVKSAYKLGVLLTLDHNYEYFQLEHHLHKMFP